MLPPAAPHRRARRAGVPRRTALRAVAIALALALTVLASGCRRAPTPSAAAFCRRIGANRAALTGPVVDTASTTQVLAAYRNVGAVTPVAVRDAWTTVTALLESAATVDLTQPKATEALAARALAARPEIDRIVAYTRTTCNVDIGAALRPAPAPTPAAADPASIDPAGVATIEPPGTIPATVAPKNP